MSVVNPYLADELKKYGGDDFTKCFNCGTCTAVCSLTERNAGYPRMMVRYGMVGLRKEILASSEPWLCYACGDCTGSCPRQADPGHYMATLRRYTIAQYDPTGISRLLFTSNPIAVVFLTVLALVLSLFLFTLKPGHEVSRWIFDRLPFAVIHDMGMVIFSVTGLAMFIGAFRMVRTLSADPQVKGKGFAGMRKAVQMVGRELFTMKRYQNCDTEEDSYWKGKAWYVQPWFVHWSVMWGFIGLLTATVLDFLLKDPATSIWWPSRILGTAAGLLLVYGTTMALNYRRKKVTKAYEETTLADRIFLWFLWTAGITGFWLEIAVAFHSDLFINHFVFFIHTVISMELVLLFAFSKFAHALYRPIALFFYFLRSQSDLNKNKSL